jgi:PAS domain S-box-containing protein
MNAVVSLAGPRVDQLDPEQLTDAFDVCPEGLAVVENARILRANLAFARVFGYRQSAEVWGRTLVDFLPEDRLCAQLTPAGSEPNHPQCGYPACRFEGKRRDGTRVEMEARCAPFRSGERSLLVIAARDVSQVERRRVVRESERRFRAIFDASAIGIGHCTPAGRMVESNSALERLLGYSHEELRGMHLREFIHPDDLEIGLGGFQEIAAGRRDSYQAEMRYLRKGRGHGWARLTVSLVRGPDGNPEFVIGMVEDVTERKRAEQELHEAHKMEAIGRLVGGVAHDFNNLLTGVMLYTDLLRAGLESGSRLRHHVEEIRMAAEQGAALIQQLLAVARQQVVEPRVLSLNEVVSGMRNLLARLIGENIELVTNLADDLGSVKMDPAQAQQIILNLVLNARDAMPDGGRVTLETRNCNHDGWPSREPKPALERGVVLSVSDTGCGMDAETRARLFEPFFTTKRPGRGNGLGLATVQSALKQCGGDIRVQSEPGKGTQVDILLPWVESEIAAHSDAQSTENAAGHETVLLVEDDSSVRRSAQRVLSEGGYRVLQAANGAEALKICRNHKGDIHLLLADVVMPGMSGRQVAQHVRALRPGLRVLYTTGYAQASAGDRVEAEPMVVFRKPFTGSALLHKVREVLDQNRSPIRNEKKREKP